nr:hypothetical protein [Tanacetum cinerariifolium]
MKLEKTKRSKHSGFKRQRKGRINQEEVNAASKGVNAASKGVNAIEPTIFDDEEIAQKLHDKEVKKAAAKDKQEKDDLERAQWQLSSLAVGTSSASGNSITGSGNALCILFPP